MSNTKYSINSVFDFIVTYKQVNDGNSPTYKEIGAEFGIPSSSTVQGILKRLAKEGRIVNGGNRGIKVMGGEWSYEEP